MVRYIPHKEVVDAAEEEYLPVEADFPYSTRALY
jgi:hypothetical protein